MTDAETIGTWTAVATVVVGTIGIGITLVRHMLATAYDKGVSDNRITNLEVAIEGVPAALTALTAGAAALTTGMSAMQHTTERLDRALERMEKRIDGRREP